MIEFTARDRLKLLSGASALLLSACGGGSGNSAPAVSTSPASTPLPPPAPPAPPAPTPPPPAAPIGFVDGLLRDNFRPNFKMGVALSSSQSDVMDPSAVLAQAQFNSITPEFELKADIIAPEEGVFNFDGADRIVDWSLENDMEVRGHALLWHETTPAYFLQGTREDIRARLETYITTVVDHFKDRVSIWDVVNEVISVDLFSGDAAIGPDRRSPWFEAVGNADYIDWAFLAARAADPAAKLFLNDFETENPQKRAWMIEIVQRLISRDIPIDGVGHQFHLKLNTPVTETMAAIDAVDNEFAGLINHVTELDTTFYLDPGSCYETQMQCQADLGLTPPPEMFTSQAQLLRDLFNALILKPSVESVTSWGVRDGDSWLNTAPITRINHPLLFDRDGAPKPAYFAITDANFRL